MTRIFTSSILGLSFDSSLFLTGLSITETIFFPKSPVAHPRIVLYAVGFSLT
ncbi:hypothetical protein EG68_12405 [Paragonimus skrjabini miyazakii]|uniref:Uncharacterized protein n=1 Tax=Paragonimus skrjabini miyazakii TaxID=59628 RepID=A0A8S9YNA4_9TREM|nr:hypothetical protein EG68_12405 [Paragonimus skrjabini miyazakii]